MTIAKETDGVQPQPEESLIDMANKLVETADKLLTAAYVLATLVEEKLPQGSILRALLDYDDTPMEKQWIKPAPPLSPAIKRALLDYDDIPMEKQWIKPAPPLSPAIKRFKRPEEWPGSLGPWVTTTNSTSGPFNTTIGHTGYDQS